MKDNRTGLKTKQYRSSLHIGTRVDSHRIWWQGGVAMRLNEYMCHAHLVRIRQKRLSNGAVVVLLISYLFISLIYLSFKYIL
jgi:hypothetical protein